MPKGTINFRYGMRLRGFSPGAQPKKDFVKREDDRSGKYFDVLVYSRRLTDREIVQYELDDLNNKDIRPLTRYREMAGLRQTELAKMSGVPLKSIQRFELIGMKVCALDTALRLAKVLGCKAEDFKDWE